MRKIVLLTSVLLLSLYSGDEDEPIKPITEKRDQYSQQAEQERAEQQKKKKKVSWDENLEIEQEYEKSHKKASVLKYTLGENTEGIVIVKDTAALRLADGIREDNSDFTLPNLLQSGDVVPVKKPSLLKSLWDKWIKKDYNYRLTILKDIAAVGVLPRENPEQGESPYINHGAALARMRGYERDLQSEDPEKVKKAKDAIDKLFVQCNFGKVDSKTTTVNGDYRDFFADLYHGVSTFRSPWHELKNVQFSFNDNKGITIHGISPNGAEINRFTLKGDQAMLLKNLLNLNKDNLKVPAESFLGFLNGIESVKQLRESLMRNMRT